MKRTNNNKNQKTTPQPDQTEKGLYQEILGLLTGHCALNKHLFTKSAIDSPLCSPHA